MHMLVWSPFPSNIWPPYTVGAVPACVPVRGACEVFTSLKHFRDDLTAHPPDHFVCVPLVLDTLYNKVGGAMGETTDCCMGSCFLEWGVAQ